MANDQPNKLRVMVDANVLVAGSLWPRCRYPKKEASVLPPSENTKYGDLHVG